MSQLKTEILKMLYEHEEQFLSGQVISEKLDCSRTAVWKQIKRLEADGYEIESVHRRGYRLKNNEETLSEAAVAANLKTEKIGRSLYFFDTLKSTQKEAHHLAEDGAPDGSLVLADEQTGGRGRLGRPWHSPSGAGIFMSMILRPTLKPKFTPQLTLVAAVAAVKAIKSVTGLNTKIKWPNDILYNGRKLVGILTELQAEASAVKAVIIGVGMNANHESFPEELTDIATSLRIETGQEISRVALIQAFTYQFEALYNHYLKEGFPLVKLLWETYAEVTGKNVRGLNTEGEWVKGTAEGITDEGVLMIRDQHGVGHRIYSADIEITD